VSSFTKHELLRIIIVEASLYTKIELQGVAKARLLQAAALAVAHPTTSKHCCNKIAHKM